MVITLINDDKLFFIKKIFLWTFPALDSTVFLVQKSLSKKEKVMKRKKTLSSSTLAILSSLMCQNYGAAQIQNSSEFEENHFNEIQNQDILLAIEKFSDQLKIDPNLKKRYLESPEKTLQQYGFDPITIKEMMREDGFFDAEEDFEFFECSMTCACTGCCVTSVN